MNAPTPPIAAATPETLASARLSEVLVYLAQRAEGRVSVGDLLDAFGQRAFGALIAVFAAPNALPVVIPGLSLIVGMPLMILTLQMAMGRPEPWLPAAVTERSFAARDFQRLVTAMISPLRRLEGFLRPRLLGLTSPTGERFLGGIALVFAVTVFLPLPFGNMLPGIGLVLISLGTLERDGYVALAGIGIGLVGLTLATSASVGIVVAGFMAVDHFLH